jgi:ATP synthase protein I
MPNIEHNKYSREEKIIDDVGKKEVRKQRARSTGDDSVWFGLGIFGLIGWSISIPTLIGAAIGILLDKKYAGGLSWTLILLFGGLLIGCSIAWHWISKELKTIERSKKND